MPQDKNADHVPVWDLKDQMIGKPLHVAAPSTFVDGAESDGISPNEFNRGVAE